VIVSIHQPSYFPWLGLLDKISKSDVFVVMDEVQLSDSAYQHRNLFPTADGKAKYLTIPIIRRDYLKRRFRQIEIAGQEWRSRHLAFIRNSYGKHPFAAELMPKLEAFFAADYRRLADAVLASMRLSFDLFGIGTRMILQGEMQYDRSLKRGDLVVALARAAGARCYLSGAGARQYLDESAFHGDLTLRYNAFEHPRYPQKNLPQFLPGLACLDALFNVGVDGARALLDGTRNGG
jgi:hypothetical protein